MNKKAQKDFPRGLLQSKRAQGMPMNTIVLIIVVLLVLAAVGVFFFQQFATGQTGTSGAQCVQLCQSIRAQMSSNTDLEWDDIKEELGSPAKKFCEGGCDTTTTCEVRTQAETETTIEVWSTATC